jgi:hypothetical protein
MRAVGHTVNANIAMVSSFSVHRDRAEAIRRGHEGFEFFSYALNALVAHDTVPGRTNLWGEYLKLRGNRTEAGDRGRRRDQRSRLRHRHARRHARAPEGAAGLRHRSGDLHAAGRPQQARAYLRIAGAVCRPR